MSRKNNQTGNRGEFLVAAKLSEIGYSAALTLKNTPGIDILVSNGLYAKAIQVKTCNGPKPGWPCPILKKTSKDLVFIFVNLNTKKSNIPDFYIVPSSDVRKIVKAADDEYIREHPNNSGKKGVCKFIFKTEEKEKLFKNKWNNLGLKKNEI